MSFPRISVSTLLLLASTVGHAALAAGAAPSDDGVYVRFQLVKPEGARYYVRLGGFIHKPNWYLPRAVIPSGADGQADRRLASGQFTQWFDLKKHAGESLHGRLNRSGGVAEFPNVTAQFVTAPRSDSVSVVIELSTAPEEKHIVRRFSETFSGDLTSFLVSPSLRRDADSLETASQMTGRRLRWAMEATGGQRVSPGRLIVQTQFWSPQRPELNVKEAKVLSLLGFNVVGNQTPEVREQYPQFRLPGHTHRVAFGPGATRAEIESLLKTHAEKHGHMTVPGVPFNFADEICCRPRLGNNEKALECFREWLRGHAIEPGTLGVENLSDVQPLETPEALRQAETAGGPAARRVFYYTSRFRQAAGTQRIRWHTEAFHKYFPPGPVTSTLVADHPYFGGTGLGMGMVPNTTWGGAPLALDWFDLARKRAVDMIGIEDWMGLQYMYGPNSTWEGFQLMGFQASIFRSGSRGKLPIIAWITPSDETNLRLKTASALCQGAKNFFYWTYGPTATSTENYWSDLRGAYDGIAHVSRQLAAAEHILAPGQARKTRIALLYSISSDLWQPVGYIHMLERRGTYLSLIHDQYLVDMLTEEDLLAGRLADYDVLYATDPCISAGATRMVASWVARGGHLYGSCAAGSRNEFNEAVPGLAGIFGIAPTLTVETQPGEYRVRGRLNALPYLDKLHIAENPWIRPADIGIIGVKVLCQPTTATVVGTFGDGKTPAVLTHAHGKGQAVYFATTLGVSYIKDAKFVPRELKETWPPTHRRLINSCASLAQAPRLAEISHPVVELGVYDAPAGTAVVLANFTYKPIEELRVRVPVRRAVTSVRSVQRGSIPSSVQPAAEHSRAAGFPFVAAFKTKLGLDDVILLE